MVIPGCNDGKLSRGGPGGECDRPGGCNKKLVVFRECSNSPMLRSSDLYMSSDENKCSKLAPRARSNPLSSDFTHDAIIVGVGNKNIQNYWLIR